MIKKAVENMRKTKIMIPEEKKKEFDMDKLVEELLEEIRDSKSN